MWLFCWEKLNRLSCGGGLAEKNTSLRCRNHVFKLYTQLQLLCCRIDVYALKAGSRHLRTEKKILFVLKYYYYYYYIDRSEDKIQMSADALTR